MWRLCTLSTLLLTEWRYMQYQTYLLFGLILSFEAVITVKSGQISRLCTHKLKYTTNIVFHRDRNILPHLPNSMTVNNIMFLKCQLWGLISLVGTESSRFFTACQIASSTAERRRSTPLGNFFLTAFVVPDHRHDVYIHPGEAKQFSQHHKHVLLEGITTT